MVQQLRKMGMTQKTIRKLTGISERTIYRIGSEPTVTETNDLIFQKSHNVGRPSTVEQHEEMVRQWFEEPRKPEDGPLKTSEIFTRLKALGYEGGKSAVYDLVRRIRPHETKPPLVRFEGLPGEFSQHDFGQRRVTFEDGTTQVVHFFASRLKYSRTVDIHIVENEQLETVVRCLLRAFEHFGGMPLKCVFDNMTTVVDSRITDPDGQTQVVWNQSFGQFAIDCGFIPVACWPYRPQQKGSVENLVGFVKGNFFCGRRFHTRTDLAKQLSDWVNVVNTKRKCDATLQLPAVLLRNEPLKPCPYQAQTYAFKATAVVRPTARVRHQNIDYSVPAECIGQEVTLHLQQEAVSIYLGNRLLATHPRFPENGKSSILATHAQELFRWQRGKPYAQRQLLWDLDPAVEPYLTELVHRRPNNWEIDIARMYELYLKIGRSELLAAIDLAIEQRCFGSEYLSAIVDEVVTITSTRRR